MSNRLQVSLAEFKMATKPFRDKRQTFGIALLAFEGGFLSIEASEVTAVMHAEGSWIGRATFSGSALQAIALYPPQMNPLVITYADNHLLIANITIACNWHSVSKAIVQNLESPSMIDLLAIERTLPRSEIAATSLGKQVRLAKAKMKRRVAKAAKALEDLGISETEIQMLLEAKIQSKLQSDEQAASK